MSVYYGPDQDDPFDDNYSVEDEAGESDAILIASAVTRSMREWRMLETPMTPDDVLDTRVWIQRLP